MYEGMDEYEEDTRFIGGDAVVRGLLGGILLAGRAEPYCVPDERQSADEAKRKDRIWSICSKAAVRAA